MIVGLRKMSLWRLFDGLFNGAASTKGSVATAPLHGVAFVFELIGGTVDPGRVAMLSGAGKEACREGLADGWSFKEDIKCWRFILVVDSSDWGNLGIRANASTFGSCLDN